MTIKQQGGIFGRNPTFNDLTVDGEFVSNGNVEIAGTVSADDQITVEKNSPASVGPKLYLHNTANDGNTGHAAEIRFNLRAAEATSRNALIGAKALGTYGSDPYIYFSTSETDAGEPTERVKVLNTGDLELVSGNLVVSSGSGIDFSATSGTGTSELFDDYEEGSYTGTLTPTTSGSITVNAAAQTMNYTKIGRVVFISGFLEVGSASSPVGNDVLLNLPFTVSSLPQDSSRMSSSIYVDNTLVPVRVFNGNTSAYIGRDASLITTGDQFYVSFNYIAA